MREPCCYEDDGGSHYHCSKCGAVCSMMGHRKPEMCALARAQGRDRPEFVNAVHEPVHAPDQGSDPMPERDRLVLAARNLIQVMDRLGYASVADEANAAWEELREASDAF